MRWLLEVASGAVDVLVLWVLFLGIVCYDYANFLNKNTDRIFWKLPAGVLPIRRYALDSAHVNIVEL